MDRISRSLLARAGEQRILSKEAMKTALALTGLRPSKAEWRSFAILAMRFSGVLSVAAGMVFLVAFNWQNFGVYARFAVVETPLLAALIFAWIKGTEWTSGKLSLMLAVLLTGTLLGLFGQTYQTGANVYELFLAWTVLSLPWVIACRYAPCWALWLLLLNTAVVLYSAWPEAPWSLPFLLNVVVYALLAAMSAERWLQRAVMAAAMAFGTFAIVVRIFDRAILSSSEPIVFLAASAGFALYAFARKEDLFNFAVLALAFVVVTTSGFARAVDRAGIEWLLLLGIYVILASAAAVKGIAEVGRRWKAEEASP